jgi:hypothetical protein
MSLFFEFRSFFRYFLNFLEYKTFIFYILISKNKLILIDNLNFEFFIRLNNIIFNLFFYSKILFS